MARIYRQAYLKPVPEGAKFKTRDGKTVVTFTAKDGRKMTGTLTDKGKVRLLTATWYAEFRDADGQLVQKALGVTSRDVAQRMLASLVREVEQQRAGVRDVFREHRGRPLTEHLADFEAVLRARRNTEKHVAQVAGHVRRLIDGCGFQVIEDISASKVEEWIALQRAKGERGRLEPGRKSYTVREVASALGLKSPSVCPFARRFGIEATGNGKARRFSRQDAEALLERAPAGGASIQTANYYLGDFKAFCRWLVTDRRAALNPVAHLKADNVREDRRHERRRLTNDELASLIQTARGSDKTWRGLTGPDRAALYLTAASTGFRASELASLTPASFDFGDRPAVHLAARSAKNGRPACQPIPPDVAGRLADYLAGRPARLPVWGEAWSASAAEMLRGDLEAAGIPYVVDCHDGPRVADFHSLRFTYIARVIQSGASASEAVQLARHSRPELTIGVYGRIGIHDLGRAVDRLTGTLTVPGDTQGYQDRVG